MGCSQTNTIDSDGTKVGGEGITVTQSVELIETNRSTTCVNKGAETWDEIARNMRIRDMSIAGQDDHRDRRRKMGTSEEDLVSV